MTFLHTRDGVALVTTCQLCGMSTRSLSESAIYLSQRGHDAMTCQRRRAERAWVVEAPEVEDDVDRCPDGHERAGNTHVDTRGNLVCNACRREKRAAKNRDARLRVSQAMSTELGVALGRIETDETAPDLTPRPPLSTPNRRNRKECA